MRIELHEMDKRMVCRKCGYRPNVLRRIAMWFLQGKDIICTEMNQ